MKPTISVITINFNNANGLRNTLDSLAGQSYGDFESIIIDGGSTDGSVEVIRDFQNLGRPNISHWVSERDSGIYHAQNKGAKVSSGRYFLFLNSGDYLANPNILEALRPNEWITDLVCGHIYVLGEEKVQLSKTPEKISLRHMLVASLNHPATFISRSLFERSGPYDESYRICADYRFFLNAIFRYEATIDIRDEVVSVFPLGGISSSEKLLDLHQRERRRAQRETLSANILELLEELRKMESRMNSFKFALLAIPRYVRRRLAKRRDQW